MPIFMDRHDVRDMTAEAIAAAHRQDLSVQDKYGVKSGYRRDDDSVGTSQGVEPG